MVVSILLLPPLLFMVGLLWGSLRPFWGYLGHNPGVTHRLCNGSGSIEQEEGKCWELIEVNNDSIEESREALCLARSMPQEERGWEEVSWEESDLARFSKFLGFSTEGLEKDILEFLVKIRKRRERVHSKVLLEKSRFERELKRLECSINYEGGRRRSVVQGKRVPDYGSPMKIRLLSWNVRGANDSSKRKVIKAMIRSQKVDLELGGILICWDKRTLEECMGRSKEDREILWEELGAIRGIWDDPWCLGGDFNVTLSQRERSNQGRLTGAMRRFCSGGGIRRGPSPFRFENIWLKVDGFKELLRGWWQEAGGRGRASFRLATKMKVLKDKIKGWNRDVFGRLEVNKNLALQQKRIGDKCQGSSGLRKGIRNRGFFHRMANAHRRNNSMEKIKINGRWLEEEQELKAWNTFTEEEIHAALMGMNGDKALGPDGFMVAFWQSCWDFREGGDCGYVQGFFEEKPFLLGGLYKLLAKVLANRPKKVLDKVVSADQNAFVKGRQILDASLIANEVMHKMGFGARWMEWIWWCISTANFSILVNGVPAARQDHLTYLSWILAWFEATSGLKINLAKSEIIPVGEVEDIDELAVEIGCRVGALPIVYLGLPLGANHKATAMWRGGSKNEKKEKGGLGIRKIDLLNKALLGKWIWRFAFEKQILWKKCWGEVCYEGFGWRTSEARGTFGVGWCGNEALSQTFLQLFALAAQRNASVNEMWDSSLGQGGWNIRLSRNSNDWELDALGELFHMLRDLRISPEEDSLIWKGGGHGVFQIRDAYKLLTVPSAITFPKKSIWVDKVPTKVAFFAWEAT
ncbi:hypothetical protein CK203_103819 [Vitis vinifera]|uniref:Reverse transcriptase domain-containing protein n=1 Tax=Vitis vinifera TaxID=29760 RepID=A0A438CTK7_VITVI|nr:hypothetical protein CK203_103819 [Vitis vinifera]